MAEGPDQVLADASRRAGRLQRQPIDSMAASRGTAAKWPLDSAGRETDAGPFIQWYVCRAGGAAAGEMGPLNSPWHGTTAENMEAAALIQPWMSNAVDAQLSRPRFSTQGYMQHAYVGMHLRLRAGHCMLLNPSRYAASTS